MTQTTKRKVIALKNYPTKAPTILTAVVWLMLDRFNVSPMWWGVAYTLLAFMWMVFIFCRFNTTEVDLFEDKP